MTESANAALNAPKLQCSPYEVTIPHYIFISSSPELKPCVLEVGSPISCYFGDFWLSVKVRQETQELQAVLKCSFFLFVSTETETCLLSLPAATFRKTQVGSHFHLMSCFYFSRNLHSARCLKKKTTPKPSGVMRASRTEQWESCATAADLLLPKFLLIHSFT